MCNDILRKMQICYSSDIAKNVYYMIGTTLAQKEMEVAYENCPNDGVTQAYQSRVPRKGEVPTADEFIRYAAQAGREKTKK